MSLTFNPYSDFLVVVGMKAKGKTTFTKFVAKMLKRALAFDPTWQLGDLGFVVHYPNQVPIAFRQFPKVVYQPKEATDAYYIPFYAAARRFANYTLIIDEVDEQLGAKHIVCPDAKTIAVSGRAQGIGQIVNTRRPSDINKCIRTQGDHVVTFQMQETDDLRYMAKWINKSQDEIKSLPAYHSYYYNVSSGETVLQAPCKVI